MLGIIPGESAKESKSRDKAFDRSKEDRTNFVRKSGISLYQKSRDKS